MAIHDQLQRVRKPRVHIRFDVETGDASVMHELPFVVGVMGDFAGNDPGEPLAPLRDRKFVQISRDNFNQVMGRIKPGLNLRVKNTLDPASESDLSVQLQFRSMDDFEPARIVEQVEPLRRLKQTRDQLAELINKVDRSEELKGLLEQVLTDEQTRARMADELNHGGDGSKGGERS